MPEYVLAFNPITESIWKKLRSRFLSLQVFYKTEAGVSQSNWSSRETSICCSVYTHTPASVRPGADQPHPDSKARREAAV